MKKQKSMGLLERKRIDRAQRRRKKRIQMTIGAICAAPMIIGKLGYLSGRSAVCYPGFEKYLVGANISPKSVVVDENFITAKGMGVAQQFGLALVAAAMGEEEADELKKSTMMQA